jgi:hypothetical protein
MRLLQCLVLTGVALLLAGCQLTPGEGSLGRVLVSEVPLQRTALHQFSRWSPGWISLTVKSVPDGWCRYAV